MKRSNQNKAWKLSELRRERSEFRDFGVAVIDMYQKRETRIRIPVSRQRGKPYKVRHIIARELSSAIPEVYRRMGNTEVSIIQSGGLSNTQGIQ